MSDSAIADFLDLTYRADMDVLIGRWRRNVDDAEIRAGYSALRDTALAHQCRRWLLDARRRTDRRRNAPAWVTTELLPAVQHTLQEPLRVAFLVLPDHYREVGPGGGLGVFQYARFLEEGAAYAWLEATSAA